MTEEQLNDLPLSATVIIKFAADAKEEMDRPKTARDVNDLCRWLQEASAQGAHAAYIKALLAITGTTNPYAISELINDEIKSRIGDGK